MVKNQLSQYSATESGLGFLYQFEVAFLTLLKNPGNEISIETIDDVVVEKNDKILEIIQSKHHVSEKGSLHNTSQDIWKTLNIWLDGFNEIKKNNPFVKRILLTTDESKTTQAAYFLQQDEQVRNPKKAMDILENIAKTSDALKNKKIYKKFLRFNPELKKELFESIYVFDGSLKIQDARNKIMNEIAKRGRKEFEKQFFERVWGLWINMVTDILATKSKSTISYDEFHSHIQDIRDEFNRESLPIDFIYKDPTQKQIKTYMDKIFVQQLNWIMATEPIIELAIVDYWKAYQQRSKWIKDELLFDKELIQYEKRLVDAWKKQFEMKKWELGTSKENSKKIEKGREILNWVNSTTSLCIRDRCTEPYVTQGSYHMLANRKKIGWHVDFEKKLKSIIRHATETPA
ncbi:ABC-three component system protein [Nitrosopumilus adriaticus]|uniref:ABC-three component systems C-terminal domain-containing protein n=1 Tax=Nitrosopumilus adriaticus TaxID=1580092 RepID=A0A0D5C3B5_9ARCH|nr:ABC-three component system protein [Nitrosopumilus adriaticus]AJW71226.1 hypothetical protein NADRNF5_1545 [Nitrosopumilus adriaticus]